jgi:hypothetical protein
MTSAELLVDAFGRIHRVAVKLVSADLVRRRSEDGGFSADLT